MLLDAATVTTLKEQGTSDDATLVRAVDVHQWAALRFPSGAHWKDNRVRFGLRSMHATRVVLELFRQNLGTTATHSFVLTKGADNIFRGVVDGLPLGTLYGYRCWGPNWPYDPRWRPGRTDGFRADVDGRGNRFNPNKLLIDPYARELSHDRENGAMKEAGHHAEMYGSGPGTYSGFESNPTARRVFDTAPWAPKSVVVADETPIGIKPRTPQKDLIIYETHLRGFTKHPSTARLSQLLRGHTGFDAVKDIPEPYRGTYRGAGMMAPYLRALGITSVEFLPVHETANDLNSQELAPDRTALDPPSGNYWGYMTYGYFAPDRRYAFDRSYGGPTREFKAMVRAFHEAGLEVYIDVVYNHHGEGGLWNGDSDTAEVLSLRGVDNASYYALTGSGKRHYWESTGCGNNLNCSHPMVRDLICDSIEYWTLQMGVDGLRFDLAAVLGREAHVGYQFRRDAPILKRIGELSRTHDAKIIAEAWDTAESLVGSFPAEWAEWNGNFRDAVRSFLRGDSSAARAFMDAVNGGYHQFGALRGPHKAVNFVCAHDGFTLLDLVSYNEKNNIQPWPFGPSDGGSDNNLSWDSGGDHALRRQRMRNFVAVQLMSRGVPMLVGGDEFGRTQNGNNNPYKLDSVATWQNYAAVATDAPTRIPTEGPGSYNDNFGVHQSAQRGNGWFRFVCFMLRLRRAHTALRQDKYGDMIINAGDDVTMMFRAVDGVRDPQPDARTLQWYIDGSPVGDCDFLILLNTEERSHCFELMPPDAGTYWQRIVDTASWAETNDNFWSPTERHPHRFEGGNPYGVHPHSVVIFQQRALSERRTNRGSRRKRSEPQGRERHPQPARVRQGGSAK